MKDENCQYTLRNIPPALDRALRERAENEGKSLNQVAPRPSSAASACPSGEEATHDLDHLIGTWQDDPAFDEAVALQDMVDPEAWH